MALLQILQFVSQNFASVASTRRSVCLLSPCCVGSSLSCFSVLNVHSPRMVLLAILRPTTPWSVTGSPSSLASTISSWMAKTWRLDDCMYESADMRRPSLILHIQGTRLTVFHLKDVWEDLPCGVLGYCVPRAPIPYLRCFKIKPRSLSVQYPRRHECLALNHYDPGFTWSYRPLYLPFRHLRALFGWPVRFVMCLHMSR